MQLVDVLYHKSVLEVFSSEIEKFGLIETGGVLLGYNQNNQLIITRATDGGPKAIHEDFYFQADSHYIDMIIDMEYANSDGKIGYVGEWHSHPQIYPTPSEVDLNSLLEITESSKTTNILLIIGAVDFDNTKFIDQTISIIKKFNENKFYSLNQIIF
ncbi:Mov34/MPN/PAD-1 family protein [Gillisia sp. Hel_I_86]|uniref:Mov34/MPN/PAD-1 family protein n=1 Tax=Gillisia sp. Hel_I_86 TaxID=1249981 RepID=UPI0016451CD6|nr:Mov34/MPN/PAD-1 family protein [Gillisia sp. Hel_I_86]